MAKPIKETPILKGKDAERFIEQHNSKKDSDYTKSEKERIMRNYNNFKSAENSSRHFASSNK